ncbi:MAG: formylglycine-generating enzyme family protein [Alkalinema sp. RU_4_3]|nr:formylglycine-generating enzyme family protein [Alkalinema sp. RU_4_3]
MALNLQHRKLKAQFYPEALSDDVNLDMVFIKGGTFTMGSPEEEPERTKAEGPQHEVTVPDFFMGKYQVTQEQWQVVSAYPQVNIKLEFNPSSFEGKNLPVEQVSWDECVEFCDRLSKHSGRTYSLPSESQWEYACRGGTTTPFAFGYTLSTDLANYDGDFVYADGPKGENRGETIAVGSFPANAFGLYDMHGNVYEWCLDHWHDNYEGAPIDGTAWCEKGSDADAARVLRGGSWITDPRWCRSAYRYDLAAGSPYDGLVGFRVVVSALPRILP